MNKIDLDGQNVIITGGAQGLGFAMAQRIIASGATVSLWDMNGDLLKKAAQELGDAASFVVVDITDPDAVVKAHKTAEAANGPVSIMVNSAGIAGPIA